MPKKEQLEEKIEAKKEVLEADLAEMKDAKQSLSVHRKQLLLDLHTANRELLAGTTSGQRRLLKAFPGLVSIDHKETMEKLKRAISGTNTAERFGVKSNSGKLRRINRYRRKHPPALAQYQ